MFVLNSKWRCRWSGELDGYRRWKKRDGGLLRLPGSNPVHFRSGRKSVPLDCLAGLCPVSTNAAGTKWSLGYCSHWQGHMLAGLRTLHFLFTHRWPLGSFLLVAQLCYSCSLDTTSLYGGCKSFFISMELPNLLLFQRDESENKPECINW